MFYLLKSTFIILLLFVKALVLGQTSISGIPLSFSNEFQAQFGNTLPEEQFLSNPDVKQVREEIKKSPTDRRISIPIFTDFSLVNSGAWIEMSNGDRIWRLQLRAYAAKGLVVMYDNFMLPQGSKLFVYSPDKQQLLGAYTSSNNSSSNRFLTGIIKGDALVIEYFEPAYSKNQGSLHLFRIDYLFEDVPKAVSDYPFQVAAAVKLGFGTSVDCHINVNCQQGDPWQTVKKGVCRVMMVLEEGIGWCSGTMLNNTENDGKPYLLSAYHCQDGYTPMYDLWRFDFNYESSTCENPNAEPSFVSVLGSELRSSWRNTDFLLLEINTIPSDYQVYLNGWRKNMVVPTQTTLIHHPTADIKKITTESKPAQIFPASILWNNEVTTPPNHHFRVTFNQGGTFQMGSSGGGLFDQNKRLVAQLHGGFPDTLCRVTTAYLGRLALSWEGGGTRETRLKDWLDPNNKNLDQVDGIENPLGNTFVLQGKVTIFSGEGIANVSLSIGLGLETKTDLAGNYFFSELSPSQVYQIVPTKNTNLQNGLSALDLLKIQKHLLNIELLSTSVQMIAADVNHSETISTLDLLAIQKVLLNRETTFPNNTSWRFVPEIFNLANTTGQNFNFQFPETYTVENPTTDLTINFTGIKIGDTNGSVDAKE
jgi:hypothetical protein